MSATTVGIKTCPHCGATPVKLRMLVKKLVDAEIAASWAGGELPADRAATMKALKAARVRWKEALLEIS